MTYESLLSIVKYCIGSETYKTKYESNFIQLLQNEQNYMIINYLEKMHILPLFYQKIKMYGSKFDFFIKEIEPRIDYYKFCNNFMLKEIKTIVSCLDNKNINPILLKGPSFWYDIYEETYLRPIKDLDLLFLSDEEIKKFIIIVLNLGYIPQDKEFVKNLNSYLELQDHYELAGGPFIKKIYFKPTNLELEFIKSSNININRVKCECYTENIYSITSEIGFHKSIFLYDNNTFPEISKDMFVTSKHYKSFYTMKNSTLLPYLALKIKHDIDLKIIKSVKLLGDFIKIFNKTNDEEFSESIEISKLWKIEDIYLDVLNNIADLIPETEFEGVDIKSNILSSYIKMIDAECFENNNQKL